MAKISIGERVDRLQMHREEIRVIESQLKRLKGTRDEMEARILDELDKQGLSKATGNLATVSISTITVPAVQDWDKFYMYVRKNKAFHLLERRPAAKPWREEVEARKGRAIPGVSEFQKTSLNLRNL